MTPRGHVAGFPRCGTIASNASNAKPYVVTLTVTDPSSGVTASLTIDWTVS